MKLNTLITDALNSDSPEQGLAEAIIVLRENDFNDQWIVSILNGCRLNLANDLFRSLLVKAMSDLSPHIAQTKAEPTAWIQQTLLKSLDGEQAEHQLYEVITELMAKIDRGGLIVELQAFRAQANAKSTIYEDLVLDNMDRVIR
jgi:hypothetical protein